jgi:hypothetical protein
LISKESKAALVSRKVRNGAVKPKNGKKKIILKKLLTGRYFRKRIIKLPAIIQKNFLNPGIK